MTTLQHSILTTCCIVLIISCFCEAFMSLIPVGSGKKRSLEKKAAEETKRPFSFLKLGRRAEDNLLSHRRDEDRMWNERRAGDWPLGREALERPLFKRKNRGAERAGGSKRQDSIDFTKFYGLWGKKELSEDDEIKMLEYLRKRALDELGPMLFRRGSKGNDGPMLPKKDAADTRSMCKRAIDICFNRDNNV